MLKSFLILINIIIITETVFCLQDTQIAIQPVMSKKQQLIFDEIERLASEIKYSATVKGIKI